MAPSEAFNTAKDEVEKLKQKPDTNELLQLYALYKQAVQDPPIESAEKPGMMDLKGKTKRKEWQKIVDEGVTPDQAAEKYVALVEQLKEKYGMQEA